MKVSEAATTAGSVVGIAASVGWLWYLTRPTAAPAGAAAPTTVQKAPSTTLDVFH